VQRRFLHRLATLLPAQVAPILIADAGFKVPFFRAVERLGWRWVGPVRGRDQVRLNAGWVSCKTLFERATTTARLLGQGQWVRSNPLRGLFVLVRQPRKGRHPRTRAGKRARSKASTQYARLAKEPWLLVASTRVVGSRWSAKRIVRMYRQRRQIEPSFRDLKSAHFGEGREYSRSNGVGRFTVLVLIASRAAFVMWLLGTAAAQRGFDQHLPSRQWQAPRLLAPVPRPPAPTRTVSPLAR
jgi:hypothetical protein